MICIKESPLPYKKKTQPTSLERSQQMDEIYNPYGSFVKLFIDKLFSKF